jgi:GTP-binding protein Era
MIAVLGEANAGKSTLINQLVGQKVSIVSAKPHTTRYGIYGIVCQEENQFIFMDTPGFLFQPRGPLQEAMAKVTLRCLYEADLVLVVLDASRPSHQLMTSLQALSGIFPEGKPLIIALNKVDRIAKGILLPLAQQVRPFSEEIMMISGKKGTGVKDLLGIIENKLQMGPWLFPEEDFTQISGKFWAAEMTREKIFSHVHQEIPYHVHVETTRWEENRKRLILEQTIYVAKDGQKKLIIGHKGRRLSIIGQQARYELSQHFGKAVHLFLFIKVDPHWLPRLKVPTSFL